MALLVLLVLSADWLALLRSKRKNTWFGLSLRSAGGRLKLTWLRSISPGAKTPPTMIWHILEIASAGEIHRAVKVRRSAEHATNCAGQRLHDLAVAARLELSKVIAVQQIDASFFAGAGEQMWMRRAAGGIGSTAGRRRCGSYVRLCRGRSARRPLRRVKG